MKMPRTNYFTNCIRKYSQLFYIWRERSESRWRREAWEFIRQVSSMQQNKQTEEKAKVVAAVWGMELIQFHAPLQIQHQDDLKKRMIRIKDTWRIGCFEKWIIIHFTPYQTTTLPNWIFSKIIWFKSSLPLNGQYVPLLFCLYLFLFMHHTNM